MKKRLILLILIGLLIFFFYPRSFSLGNKDLKCIGFVKSGVMTMDIPPSLYIPNICFGILKNIKKDTPVAPLNPHVDPKTGWYIPFKYQAKLKNTQTGKTFDYTDVQGSLEDCAKTNCKEVYFFTDWNGNVNGLSLETDINNTNSIRGKINSVTLENKNTQASYLISYYYMGKEYKSFYKENLCRNAKGGSTYCMSASAHAGDYVNIILDKDEKTIQYLSFINVIKAEVISLTKID